MVVMLVLGTEAGEDLHCSTFMMVVPQSTALGVHWAWTRPNAAAVAKRTARNLAILVVCCLDG